MVNGNLDTKIVAINKEKKTRLVAGGGLRLSFLAS